MVTLVPVLTTTYVKHDYVVNGPEFSYEDLHLEYFLISKIKGLSQCTPQECFLLLINFNFVYFYKLVYTMKIETLQNFLKYVYYLF